MDLQDGSEEIASIDLNVRDKSGRTALYIAAEIKNIDAATWLLDRDADFLLPNRHGKNAAHVAAAVFCRRIIEMIFSYDVREYRRDHQGRSFLHFLLAWADEEFVKQAVKDKRLRVNVLDRMKRTPLHYAVLHSNTGSARAMLSLGAAVHILDSNHCTALHYAIRNGNLELMGLLQDHGASFQQRNLFDQTCWQMGILSGHPEMIKHFLNLKLSAADIAHADAFRRSPFYDLCRAIHSMSFLGIGLHDTLRELAEYAFDHLHSSGADVNLPDRNGHGPLHIAVMNHSHELAIRLLGITGLNPSLADKYGCSPLDWATAIRSQVLMDLLNQRGARSIADSEAMKSLQTRFPVEPNIFASCTLNAEDHAVGHPGVSRPFEYDIARAIEEGLNWTDPNREQPHVWYWDAKNEQYLEELLQSYDASICAAYFALDKLEDRSKYLLNKWTELGYHLKTPATLSGVALMDRAATTYSNRVMKSIRPAGNFVSQPSNKETNASLSVRDWLDEVHVRYMNQELRPPEWPSSSEF